MEWYPLFSKAFSCSTFAEFKISILEEFLENFVLAVDIGNCLIIWEGMVGGCSNVQQSIVWFSVKFVRTIG